MRNYNFVDRELARLSKENSKGKAFAFSFEYLEGIYNMLVTRDPYDNQVLDETLSDFFQKKIDSNADLTDSLLQIIDYTMGPLEKIIDTPKTQLLKVDELQGVNKIKKTNFKTMQWLGSKSGNTIAEKVGVRGKVLAPKSRYSIDKKENRIVTFYMKKNMELLEQRYNSFKGINEEAPKSFLGTYHKLHKLKRKMIQNGMYSLKRPLDFEPNNTLIDHRDYSTVNRGLKYLNEYIKTSVSNEKELLNQTLSILFLLLGNMISNLDKVKVLNKKINIQNDFLKNNHYNNFEFYLEADETTNIVCILNKEDSEISIEISKLVPTDTMKIKILSKEKFEFKISFEEFKEEKFLEIKVDSLNKTYPLNIHGIESLSKDILKELLKKLGDLSNEEEKKILTVDKDFYINLSSTIPYLNDEEVKFSFYSDSLNTFLSPDEYYEIKERKEDFSSIKNISISNTDKVSRYFRKLKEGYRFEKGVFSIYPSLERLNPDTQKDLYSIYNSNFPGSYPVWRSILACYSIDFNSGWIKDGEKILCIDCNSSIPSLNIVEKKKGIYEHHPALDYNDNIDLITLEKFLNSYLEKYCEKYNVKLSSHEFENLLSSGKVYNAVFRGSKYFIKTKKDKFYLKKDSDIYTEVQSKRKWKLKILKEKVNKNLKIQYDGLIIIGDHFDLLDDLDTKKIKSVKEVELSLGKEIILEKIKSKQIVWNEYLPNLTLEILKDKHFYNLDLIKDKAIELTLGEEVKFRVDEKLLLPVGLEKIEFPLHSEDTLNKKIYSLEVKNGTLFPLNEEMEVSLTIGFTYGSKDPYRVIIEPTNKDIKPSTFETKWHENIKEFAMKSPSFPNIENTISEEDAIKIIDTIPNYLDIKKGDYLFEESCKYLINHLKINKNKLRKYIVKEINNNNYSLIIDGLFKREGVKLLFESIIEEREISQEVKQKLKRAKIGNNESLRYKEFQKESKLFLASFGALISLVSKVDGKENFSYRKRSSLFLYKFTKIKFSEVFKIPFEVINVASELAWLDDSFIENLMEKESELVNKSFKFMKNQLINLNQNFEQEYRNVCEKNKIWQMACNFRDYLEFILAVLMVKSQIVLDKKELFEIMYNIKAIDRKIQLETIKYPGLKYEFDKNVRVKFEVDKKEELQGMSDLAYVVYNYMTGADGSELIKIKEVEDKEN